MEKKPALVLLTLILVPLLLLVTGCVAGQDAANSGTASAPGGSPPGFPVPPTSEVPVTVPARTGSYGSAAQATVPAMTATTTPLATTPNIRDFDTETNSTSDEDYVPAQCCYPTSCTTKADRPDGSGIKCAAVCVGPLDCGAGRCVCDRGVCGINTPPLDRVTRLMQHGYLNTR